MSQSHSVAIPHYRPAAREPGRRPHLLLGMLMGLIVGALGFAILEYTVDLVHASFSTGAPVAASPAEGPHEWRLKRGEFIFEDAPAVPPRRRSPYPEDGGLAWIRDSGRSPR